MLTFKLVVPARLLMSIARQHPDVTAQDIANAANRLALEALDVHGIAALANHPVLPHISASMGPDWRVYVKATDMSHSNATVTRVYKTLEAERRDTEEGEMGLFTDDALLDELIHAPE